jgi:hypothetical protein
VGERWEVIGCQSVVGDSSNNKTCCDCQDAMPGILANAVTRGVVKKNIALPRREQHYTADAEIGVGERRDSQYRLSSMRINV